MHGPSGIGQKKRDVHVEVLKTAVRGDAVNWPEPVHGRMEQGSMLAGRLRQGVDLYCV